MVYLQHAKKEEAAWKELAQEESKKEVDHLFAMLFMRIVTLSMARNGRTRINFSSNLLHEYAITEFYIGS